MTSVGESGQEWRCVCGALLGRYRVRGCGWVETRCRHCGRLAVVEWEDSDDGETGETGDDGR
jgi:hypothetical protein